MNPVRQSFNRAALSYDNVGTLQQQVAISLTELVTSKSPASFSGRLIDAGCGTGYCLKALGERYPTAKLIAVDFAERMLQQLPLAQRTLGMTADLQQLPIADSSIDLYLSSLAWQWCDPARAAQEASRILKPQGAFFITTLATATFRELEQCLQISGLNPDQHLLHCLSNEDIQSAITAAGFETLNLSTTRITTWHPDFRSLRQTIRGVGANHLPSQTTPALNRQTRKRLIDAYEQLRTDRGLPLSYEVMMIHAHKR